MTPAEAKVAEECRKAARKEPEEERKARMERMAEIVRNQSRLWARKVHQEQLAGGTTEGYGNWGRELPNAIDFGHTRLVTVFLWDLEKIRLAELGHKWVDPSDKAVNDYVAQLLADKDADRLDEKRIVKMWADARVKKEAA